MKLNKTDRYKIVNTTKNDSNIVFWLFEQAINLQGKNGYRVWEGIDRLAISKDIENGLQYKIVEGTDILCIFSIQLNDPFIWRDRDQNDAIYLHRMVVHPNFRGQKQFEKVLNWIKQFARQNNLKYLRMDTWEDNKRLIEYYMSFGFEFIENYKTTDTPELPVYHRNLHVSLLEMELKLE